MWYDVFAFLSLREKRSTFRTRRNLIAPLAKHRYRCATTLEMRLNRAVVTARRDKILIRLSQEKGRKRKRMYASLCMRSLCVYLCVCFSLSIYINICVCACMCISAVWLRSPRSLRYHESNWLAGYKPRERIQREREREEPSKS